VYKKTFLITTNVGANPEFVKKGNTAPSMVPKPTTIYFQATPSLGIIPLPTPTDLDGDPIDVRIDVDAGLMTDGSNIMTFGTFAIRDTAYNVKITLTDTPADEDENPLTTVYDVQIFIVSELPTLTVDQTEAVQQAETVIDTSGETNPEEKLATKVDGTVVPESELTEKDKADIATEVAKEEAVDEVAKSDTVAAIFNQAIIEETGSKANDAASFIAEQK
jgi:hypothetical protein